MTTQVHRLTKKLASRGTAFRMFFQYGNNPEFIAIMQRIVDTAARHGIAAGAHFSKLSHAQRLIQQGGRFIPFSSDARYIQFGVAESLHALGAAAGRVQEKVI